MKDNKIKFTVDNDVHELLYIEFINEVPFFAISTTYVESSDYNQLHEWNIFKYQDQIYFYEAGCGGSIEDGIYSPCFAENRILAEYWKSDKIKFKDNKLPENAKKLLKIKNNIWEDFIECYQYVYCEECNKDIPECMCEYHMYVDNEGELRYITTDEYVY